MSRNPKMQYGVRALSIRERAYLHIQRLIANGTLKAGGGISELILAKELGSSRTPVREAMNQLVAEGLLNQNASGGMVVAQLAREDIVELYELREALEVFAVGKAARTSMLPADKDRLQLLIDEIQMLEKELEKCRKNLLDAKQMERFIAADLGFHALLMSMAHNSRLQKIINDTRLLIRIFAIDRSGHDRETLKSIRDYHQMILNAVASQDGESAKKALAQHIQASQRERLNEYDHWRRELSLQQAIPVFFDIHKKTPQ